MEPLLKLVVKAAQNLLPINTVGGPIAQSVSPAKSVQQNSNVLNLMLSKNENLVNHMKILGGPFPQDVMSQMGIIEQKQQIQGLGAQIICRNSPINSPQSKTNFGGFALHTPIFNKSYFGQNLHAVGLQPQQIEQITGNAVPPNIFQQIIPQVHQQQNSPFINNGPVPITAQQNFRSSPIEDNNKAGSPEPAAHFQGRPLDKANLIKIIKKDSSLGTSKTPSKTYTHVSPIEQNNSPLLQTFRPKSKFESPHLNKNLKLRAIEAILDLTFGVDTPDSAILLKIDFLQKSSNPCLASNLFNGNAFGDDQSPLMSGDNPQGSGCGGFFSSNQHSGKNLNTAQCATRGGGSRVNGILFNNSGASQKPQVDYQHVTRVIIDYMKLMLPCSHYFEQLYLEENRGKEWLKIMNNVANHQRGVQFISNKNLSYKMRQEFTKTSQQNQTIKNSKDSSSQSQVERGGVNQHVLQRDDSSVEFSSNSRSQYLRMVTQNVPSYVDPHGSGSHDPYLRSKFLKKTVTNPVMSFKSNIQKNNNEQSSQFHISLANQNNMPKFKRGMLTKNVSNLSSLNQNKDVMVQRNDEVFEDIIDEESKSLKQDNSRQIEINGRVKNGYNPNLSYQRNQGSNFSRVYQSKFTQKLGVPTISLQYSNNQSSRRLVIPQKDEKLEISQSPDQSQKKLKQLADMPSNSNKSAVPPLEEHVVSDDEQEDSDEGDQMDINERQSNEYLEIDSAQERELNQKCDHTNKNDQSSIAQQISHGQLNPEKYSLLRRDTRGEVNCEEFDQQFNVHKPVISEVQSNFVKFHRMLQVKVRMTTNARAKGENIQPSIDSHFIDSNQEPPPPQQNINVSTEQKFFVKHTFTPAIIEALSSQNYDNNEFSARVNSRQQKQKQEDQSQQVHYREIEEDKDGGDILCSYERELKDIENNGEEEDRSASGGKFYDVTLKSHINLQAKQILRKKIRNAHEGNQYSRQQSRKSIENRYRSRNSSGCMSRNDVLNPVKTREILMHIPSQMGSEIMSHIDSQCQPMRKNSRMCVRSKESRCIGFPISMYNQKNGNIRSGGDSQFSANNDSKERLNKTDLLKHFEKHRDRSPIKPGDQLSIKQSKINWNEELYVNPSIMGNKSHAIDFEQKLNISSKEKFMKKNRMLNMIRKISENVVGFKGLNRDNLAPANFINSHQHHSHSPMGGSIFGQNNAEPISSPQLQNNNLYAQLIGTVWHQYECLYIKTVSLRQLCQDNYNKSQEQISNAGSMMQKLDKIWKVFFVHISQKSGLPKTDSLIFKISGPDLYAFKDETLTKVRFIHHLPGCTFQIIEDTSAPQTQQNQRTPMIQFGTQPININPPSSYGQFLRIESRYQQNKKKTELHQLIGNQTQDINAEPIQNEASANKFKCQLKIKLSDESKKMFSLTNLDNAKELVTAMERAAQYWKDCKTQENLSRYKINGDDKTALLGQGSYGKVFRVTDALTGQIVALKQIEKSKMQGEDFELIQQEIELGFLLTEDEHPGIVKLLDVFEDEKNMNLVMEMIEGVNLFKWLMEVLQVQNYDEKLGQKVFWTILDTLRHIHSRCIVHRDIKLDNILIFKDERSQEWVTKIVDFGLSTVLLQNQKSQKTLGSIAYLSPEIVSGKPHDCVTDVWSMGIVLYTLLTGRMPFINNSLEITTQNILNKDLNFRQQCWVNVSEAAKDLVTRMLCKNKQERYTAEQCLIHPWVRQQQLTCLPPFSQILPPPQIQQQIQTNQQPLLVQNHLMYPIVPQPFPIFDQHQITNSQPNISQNTNTVQKPVMMVGKNDNFQNTGFQPYIQNNSNIGPFAQK